MDLETCIAKARRLARATTSGISDRDAVDWVNSAQKKFAKDVHGLTKEEYLSLAPRFDIQTNFAIRLTITGGTNALAATDVVICAASSLDQTGTQVAAALQVAILALAPTTLTVTWDLSAWKFTIDAIDSTSITLAAPSNITYINALSLLGLTAEETVSTEVIGDIPENCNLDISLPNDFLSIISNPEWDGEPLYPAPWSEFISPLSTGTPTHYSIMGKRLRLNPMPLSQKMLHIWYKYIPEDFVEISGYQECGLTTRTLVTESGLTAATQYYFKVTVEGVQVEYNITTGTTTIFASIIALMNTACLGICTWSLVNGDLRCTSDNTSGSSSIVLAIGTTGTDLFGTLTGWTAFEDSVPGEALDDLGVDDEWAMAIVYYTAYLMAMDNFEYTVADRQFVNYKMEVNNHILNMANNNTKIEPPYDIEPPLPEVIL